MRKNATVKKYSYEKREKGDKEEKMKNEFSIFS